MGAIAAAALLAAAILTSQTGVAQTSAPASPGSATGSGTAAPPTSTAPATTAPSAGSTPGAATSGTAGATSATSAAPAAPRRELAVSGIIEKDLMGSSGKAIGDIEKVVEGTSDQKKYLVVSSGGILGFFENQVAVPLDKVEVRNDQIVVRDMTEEQLKLLPKFDSNSYYDLGESQKVAVAEKK